MTYEEIVSRIADSVGLSERLVDKIYRAYWRAVKKHIELLPLKQDLTEEEVLNLKPNVNIPSIGKFYLTLGGYKRTRNTYNRIQEYRKKKNAAH